MPGEDDESSALDAVLNALANPHRRDIVYTLGLQPHPVSQLARMRGLSLPAIHKHVKILEAAGLISRHKRGRTTFLTLDPRSLRALQQWVGQFHPYWGSESATYENYAQYLGFGTPSNGPEPTRPTAITSTEPTPPTPPTGVPR